MRSTSDRKIIKLIREQYENRIYTALLEMDVTMNNGKALVSPGLEIKNKKTGQKFTIHSVQDNESGLTVSLIPSDGIAGPITSVGNEVVVPSSQAPHVYTLKDIEDNFTE